MVAKGLKDYANEKGLKISNGVAYGVIGGYMVTLKEGYGIKEISVSGAFTDESARKVTEFFQTQGAKKEYRVANFSVLREGIIIEITDTVGTMKKIREFLDFLPNFLRETGVLADGFCTACGNPIEPTESSKIVLINGMAHRVHEGCSGSLMERSNVEQARHETEEKNLGKGILGAFLGALIGGVVWAVAYYIGYFFAIIGALIGFLAVKGYEKLGGKVCKAKMPIILIATLFGAIFGQFVGDVATIMVAWECSLVDAIFSFFYLFQDPEYADFVSGFCVDLALGSLFAILGAIGVLKKASKENKEAVLTTKILE